MYSDLVITVAGSLYAARNARTSIAGPINNTPGWDNSWETCLKHAEKLVKAAQAPAPKKENPYDP